jgi:hypothetical protein
MSADIHQVVRYNLDVARRVLLVFELKKRLDELPPGPLYRIRGLLSSRVDEVKFASLPLVLVFVASCLEYYLKEILKKATPINEREKVEFEFNKLIERFRSKIGDKLARDAHELRIKRNIILHDAGIIDDQALKEFEKIGLTGYSVGAKLVLSEDEVRRHIDTCEKITQEYFL